MHRDHVLPQHPISEQRCCIVDGIAAIDPSRQPHHAEMTCQPERDAQAQKQLRDFGDGVAKMAALIERPQAERKMDCGRGVECDVDDRNSPPPDVKREPLFHQRIGNIAERMIEKMRENVGEHHQPAGEPDLPNADAAQPIGNAGRDADPKRVTPAIAGASIDMRR